MNRRFGLIVATAVATAALLTACSNVTTRTQTLGTTGGAIQLQDTQTRQLEIEPALKIDAPAEQKLAPQSPAPVIEKPAAQAASVKAVSSSASTADAPASAKSSSYHDGYSCPGKGGSAEARASSTDD
jgi:hypothetical protein